MPRRLSPLTAGQRKDAPVNLGETFVDPQKRSWTIEAFLGQGIWGRSWLARNPEGGSAVLKVALQATDFPADAPLPDDVLRACRDAAREQAKLLETGAHSFLPRLLGTLTLSSGTPALLMAHYTRNLGDAIAHNLPLVRAVDLIGDVANYLGKSGLVHGNLRPSNILINDRGQPVLADMLTPAASALLVRLEDLADGRTRWRPPEATERAAPMWDTWALCQVLYQAALHRDAATDARPVRQGLDRVEIATLKDRALARLSIEPTNARFRSRMSERLGAVLHRGLSTESQPSPPYRFVDCKVLAERLAEVMAMVSPHVEDVGRLLPAAHAVSGVHQTEGPVEFTVSVGCSAGVTNHEDVGCGMKLIDLDDANRRVPLPEAQYKVERHRSGRLRFAFDLPDIAPGRYRLKIAFSVRDSGVEPEVAAGEFEVRPPPGYIPPRVTEHETSAIVLDRIRDRAPLAPAPVAAPVAFIASDAGLITSGCRPTGHGTSPGSDPGAEIIEGLFPRPIAPPSDQAAWPVAEPVQARASQPVPQQEASVLQMPVPAVVGGAMASVMGPAASAPSAPMLAPVPSLSMPAASVAAPSSVVPPDPIRDWYGDASANFSGGGLLPGMQEDGEELPAWKAVPITDKLRNIPGYVLLKDWLERDSYNAFIAAATCCFMLLLIVMAVLNVL
jgi:hypothetical protein